MAALREAAVKHGRGLAFNALLRQLGASYEGHAQHGGFWRMLMAEACQQGRLVSDSEDPASNVSTAEAAAFLSQHSSSSQARRYACSVAVASTLLPHACSCRPMVHLTCRLLQRQRR